MKLSELKDLNFRHFSTQINKIALPSGNIQVITSYVSVRTYRFKKLPQGTKTTVIVEKNYYPKFQFTIYFDNEGNEATRRQFYKNH